MTWKMESNPYKLFADTSLFSVVVDPIISVMELNHDLQLISQWAVQWKMKFNPDPNNSPTLGCCKK